MFCAILLNDTSYDDHHGCQIVVDQIHYLAAAAGIRIIWSSPLRNDWATDAGLLAAAQRADLCLINGEGTLHDDLPAAAQLMQASEYFSSAGLPCFLINALWQNNSSLVRNLPGLAGCYLRDALSAQEVSAFRQQATVVPDLTLTLIAASGNSERRGLLINGSVLESRQREAVDQLALTQNASYLSIRTFTPIRLAAHHRAYLLLSLRQRWKHLRHRVSSFRRYPTGGVSGKLMGRFRWRHACLRRKNFLARLAAAEGVVTGRFHMVTLCLVTRTPFFAVPSNSHKIEGLLAQLGMTNRIFDSYEQALAQRGLLAFSADELQRIDSFLAGAQVGATRMFEEIAETVKHLAVAASN
jgi:hypothetical protein